MIKTSWTYSNSKISVMCQREPELCQLKATRGAINLTSAPLEINFFSDNEDNLRQRGRGQINYFPGNRSIILFVRKLALLR